MVQSVVGPLVERVILDPIELFDRHLIRFLKHYKPSQNLKKISVEKIKNFLKKWSVFPFLMGLTTH